MSSYSSVNPIALLERQTQRRITIDATETDSSLLKCNPQSDSPLFTILPRELRDLIFQFATAPFPDPSHPYKENEYYYRPGHTARWKTDTSLLLTCRRVWLEANAFPMLQAEHCFWYHRAAPDSRNQKWFSSLTQMNGENFGTLHLYAQMFVIEGFRSEEGRLKGRFTSPDPYSNHVGDKLALSQQTFQPRVFHVTIRHTDWWYWENEEPLRLKDSWVKALLDSPDLRSTQTLILELETLDYKREQLERILERVRRLESVKKKTHLVNGKPTTTFFELTGEPTISTWSGPSNIDGGTYTPYEGKEKLNYHVVTLKWHLRFPDLPTAEVHVPTLRLAPRMKPASNDTVTEAQPNPGREETQPMQHPLDVDDSGSEDNDNEDEDEDEEDDEDDYEEEGEEYYQDLDEADLPYSSSSSWRNEEDQDQDQDQSNIERQYAPIRPYFRWRFYHNDRSPRGDYGRQQRRDWEALDAQARVRLDADVQAERVERERRRAFVRPMRAMRIAAAERRWREAGALLRFVQ